MVTIYSSITSYSPPNALKIMHLLSIWNLLLHEKVKFAFIQNVIWEIWGERADLPTKFLLHARKIQQLCPSKLLLYILDNLFYCVSKHFDSIFSNAGNIIKRSDLNWPLCGVITSLLPPYSHFHPLSSLSLKKFKILPWHRPNSLSLFPTNNIAYPHLLNKCFPSCH